MVAIGELVGALPVAAHLTFGTAQFTSPFVTNFVGFASFVAGSTVLCVGLCVDAKASTLGL